MIRIINISCSISEPVDDTANSDNYNKADNGDVKRNYINCNANYDVHVVISTIKQQYNYQRELIIK